MGGIITEVPEGEYVVDIVEMQSAIDGKGRKVVMWMLAMGEPEGVRLSEAGTPDDWH
jgi:hypothetical protein